MDTTIRVLIVDDHEMILDALKQAAEQAENQDIKIVHMAKSEQQALEAAEELVFDVAVVDMRLPPVQGKIGDNEAGIRVIRKLAEHPDKPKIVGISGYLETPEFIIRVVKSGASGYILKEGAKLMQVFEAVRKVYNGGKVYPPDIVPYLVEGNSAFLRLTPREQEVWELLAEGYSNREIAYELDISIDTAKRYVSELYRKIGVSGRALATRKWLEDQYGLKELTNNN